VPAPTKAELPSAALSIPSFQSYARKMGDIEQMEQILMQKQLLLAKSKARYEKICANRVRSV